VLRLAILAILILSAPLASAADIPNEFIDYGSFKDNVSTVERLRENRRLTEKQFMRMAAEPGTVVLDARSAQKFALLHVKGAKNLSLPDITGEELAKVIPAKTTRVLIYCNNNFLNEPVAFPTKSPAASLNVHTFNVLYAYGYTNVYELGPLIDVNRARLKLEGSKVPGT
jgi:phage shock protein E